MEYTYDAFISYRHLPADMAVAEKLQKLLESRKKKDGKKLTVFRDRSDLPTTSDLGADIRHALEHSRFLIVICSHAYQYSKWCMTELEYFRQLHGGNSRILPILLEGEPEDAFPEVLRYGTQTVWDAYGNPTTVQVEMEPLGADVRADTNKERLKKLKVEYLRIAAPILGLSFDQLYQRAQRKKRAVTALVMAALAAFAVYSSILIAQITRRQKELEAKHLELQEKQAELIAKQQELYQNESIRLANEALGLTGENLPLAMLLADTALPADLSDPEYPVTEEAERAIQSAALQHQFNQASAYFTQKVVVDLPVSRWTIGAFYENGNYFTLIDFYETRLYEAHTGKLVATIPDYGYYFFAGVDCYARDTITLEESGKTWECVVYDTDTGRELNRVSMSVPDEKSPYLLTDHEGGKLWVLEQDRSGSQTVYSAYGWFDGRGNYTETDTLPDYLEAYCQDRGAVSYVDNSYVYADGTAFGHYMYDECDTMPKAYQTAYKTFSNIAGSLESYAFTPSADERLALIHFQDPEEWRYGVAFWSITENRLLGASWDTYYLEKGSGLIYHQTENRLEVLEINSDALDLPANEPVYSYVSDDGAYGIACYYAKNVYSLGVYKLAEPGYGYFEEDVGDWYTQAGTRTPVYESAVMRDRLCATADGTRIAFLTPEEELKIVDIPEGNVAARSDLSGKDICALAINDSGTRVAYLKIRKDKGFSFEVVDPDSLSIVGKVSYNWSDPENHSVNDEPYMAMSEEKVLVAFDKTAFLFDLADLEAEPMTISMSETSGYMRDVAFAQDFTKDGLLLIPSDDTAAQGAQRFIKLIVDLKTGQKLEFNHQLTYNREDYHYDDVSGNLIHRNSNAFTVQRRGADGNFDVVYTITPKHNDMELNAACHATDGTWLVLQNDECCEIYRLEDGTLWYVLAKPQDRSSQLAVIDGKLYDFCLGGEPLAIELPTTDQAREYIRDALVYEGVHRTLSDLEMEEYYIPDSWREG